MADDKEKYTVNQRIRGGSFSDRLNPAVVSTHIDQHLGAKHLPMPMVHQTNDRSVADQDANRLNRIEILSPKFKKKR
jgi:hypothetical protein